MIESSTVSLMISVLFLKRSFIRAKKTLRSISIVILDKPDFDSVFVGMDIVSPLADLVSVFVCPITFMLYHFFSFLPWVV